MASYYVNETAQSNGDHEVRVYGCIPSCSSVVTEAGKKHATANGCATCCNACHTS